MTVVCATVLIVILASTGLTMSVAVAGGLVLAAALWVTGSVLADLELAFPVTRKCRLRAGLSRSTPLVDFTTTAFAVRNAASAARRAHSSEPTIPHHEEPEVLARAMERLDQTLPALQAVNLPAATDATVRLHAELHALAAGCTPPSLLSDEEWSACQLTIEKQLDTLLDLAQQIQEEHAVRS